MRVSKVSNQQLIDVRQALGDKATSITIQQELHKRTGVMLDESTIRGRFLTMGMPLKGRKEDVKLGTQPSQTTTAPKKSIKTFTLKSYQTDPTFHKYIPHQSNFDGYIERPVDIRLSMHYEANKYPITQGKQGTGKTLGHMYYAHKAKLPFFLFSCHEEMKLHKLFGDKTIENGSIVFKEGEFVKATQQPSVILFDEVNAVSNANTFDFHALLQNRELFVKDADNGNGKWFKLHPDCKIGFAMNPKSQKYIGGHIKPSNFLGRCTFITYPEFTKAQIRAAIKKKNPTLDDAEVHQYTEYYCAVVDCINQAKLPVDISIRQLNNLIDLCGVGMELKDALEDSMSGMLDAVSQPKAKESFLRLAQAVWKELKK